MTRLVVTSISSHSAACKPVKASAASRIKVGDTLTFKRRKASTRKSSTRTARKKKNSKKRPAQTAKRTRRWKPSANIIRGYVALQNQWQKDLAGSRLGWNQPSVAGRLTIDKLGGKDVRFRVRHRSLLTMRSKSISSPFSQDGWSHRLTEAALVFGRHDSPVEIGVGRVISPSIRGIGYIDGGYFSVKVSPHYRVGAAFGTEPDAQTSSYRSDRKKGGGFVTYDRDLSPTRHFSSTLALSASYAEGQVNREFFYVQNTYSVARRLTAYQSVEIDVNRQWRKIASGNRVTFSNFYFTSNVTVTKFAALDFSFDARRNVRNYYTLNTPDSLFDARLRKGVDGGFSLSLPLGISLRGNGGIRYGDEDNQNIRFGSLSMNVRHFYRRGHNLSARVSRSTTEFTRSTRPVITYRLPIKRTRAHFSVGGALYKTANTDNNSYYYEVGGSRNFKRRYFVTGSWRHYMNGPLESLQVITEAGINF